MVQQPIDIQLAIETKGDVMIAHLQFSNNSSDKIDLDTWAIFCDNEIRNDYFKITDEDNKEVKYTGMLIKRMFRPEDFIMFKPSERINVSIAFNQVYRLVKGKKYVVKYFAYHPLSLEGRGLMLLESNEVIVQY